MFQLLGYYDKEKLLLLLLLTLTGNIEPPLLRNCNTKNEKSPPFT